MPSSSSSLNSHEIQQEQPRGEYQCILTCIEKIINQNKIIFILLEEDYPNKSIPSSLIKSFKKLYSHLEFEIEDKLNGHESNNQTHLLSMLDSNKLSSMIGNDFVATLQKKKPNVEVLYPTISITDDMQRINDPYEKLEFKDDIDVSPDTNKSKNDKAHVILPTALDFQFIEAVSIPARDKTSTPAPIKQDVSVQVNDFNVKDSEEIEIISASLCTSTLVTTPSKDKSDFSVGVIDDENAFLMLEKFGNHVSMHTVNPSDGSILMQENAMDVDKKQNGNFSSKSNSGSFDQGIKSNNLEYDEKKHAVNELSHSQHNLVKVIENNAKVGSILAREMSFQSSFDTAILLKDNSAPEAMPISECRANGSNVLEKESAEDEETLNQITPIPTTFELSS